MKYKRMPIEIESPEELGYDTIAINLAESSVTDKTLNDLRININDLLLSYGSHKGIDELRELLVKDQPHIKKNDVLLTAGAATALFIVNTTILEKEDHLIVAHPNYSTNSEVPQSVGCEISYLELKFEDSWTFKINDVERLIQPNTKLISITTPHNPTGTVISEEILTQLTALAEEKNIFLLIDETYRDLTFDNPKPYIANRSPVIISVSSVSKAYGIPGVRIGWIICKNEALMEKFLAAKEQIYISNSVVDEKIAYEFLNKSESILKEVKKKNRENFSIVKKWMEDNPYVEWIEPKGGVVGFPRIKEGVNFDRDEFYKVLLEKYSTYVGPGHWFGMSRKYFRLGFGWVEKEKLKQGLQNINNSISECLKP